MAPIYYSNFHKKGNLEDFGHAVMDFIVEHSNKQSFIIKVGNSNLGHSLIEVEDNLTMDDTLKQVHSPVKEENLVGGNLIAMTGIIMVGNPTIEEGSLIMEEGNCILVNYSNSSEF